MSLGSQPSLYLQYQPQNPDHISSLTHMDSPELFLSLVHTLAMSCQVRYQA